MFIWIFEKSLKHLTLFKWTTTEMATLNYWIYAHFIYVDNNWISGYLIWWGQNHFSEVTQAIGICFFGYFIVEFLIFWLLWTWICIHLLDKHLWKISFIAIRFILKNVFFSSFAGVCGLINVFFSAGASSPPWILHGSRYRRHWRNSNYSCSDTWWRQSNCHTCFNWGASESTLQVVKNRWYLSL